MKSLDEAQNEFWQNGGAERQLTSDVKSFTPFISTVAAPAAPQLQTQLPQHSAKQGLLPSFWGKVEDIGNEAGHLIAAAGSWVGHSLVDAVEAPVKLGIGVGHFAQDTYRTFDQERQQNELTDRLHTITQQFKSGQLTHDEYSKALKDWSKDNVALQKELEANSASLSKDIGRVVKPTIDTAADIFTVASFGLATPGVAAGERAAAGLLDEAAGLARVSEKIGALAKTETAWKAMNPSAQTAIKLATSKALEAAGQTATAAQIGKTAAGRLLLQYPLTYNMLSETGNQIYHELDNDKYGDAIKTAAFNALLLLSGGIIGQALKYGGKTLKRASVAAGIRPGSVLDELSSRAGNGDRLALGQIAAKKIASGDEDDVKAMIVALDSNLKRTGGNAPQAINNIVDHLEQYIGWGSLHNMTHEELWDNIVNYWKHAEGLDKLKKAGLIDGITSTDARAIVPGRFTTQDKNMIAEAVTQPDVTGMATKEDRLQAWQAFKQANPNIAAANNPNVDKQITHLIETIDNPEQLHSEINSIKTQIGLSGIPAEYAAKMAKDGYVAIIPKTHNLPVTAFEETSGKLATNAATGEFFVQAAQPLPVLRSIGTFLVNAGLSPEVAGQRVQDVFRGNFQQALKELDFLGPSGLKLLGESDEKTTRTILGKLYDYMKAPTGGLKVLGHTVPISDMRQLTANDIVRALDVTKAQAKDIQQAIMQAYLDVPRSIAGLGNKVMDYNFKYNPAAGVYSKIQGIGRFSWNPVFRFGKLPMKAEILAQLETGGKFPTVVGTNTFMKIFFPKQRAELESIVKNEDFKRIVPGGIGGEATEQTGVSVLGSGTKQYPKVALLPAAGLVRSMANRVDMDVETFLRERSEDAENAIHSLLHYDPKNGFLNSPMAKTLNVAFFPFRFNVKVSTYMARFLAKQNPVVQYAAVKGIMDAHQFLNSPQGMAWYSQNADAIELFKYFSPLETISTISNALGLKHDSVAQYGELGGLPFGWIPQMLDSVGLTHFSQAYVNPKTGVISQDYVPTSMYGAANAALQDFLGSVFSFPGATAGLTSKREITRRIVGGLLPGSSDEFSAIMPPNITPSDQRFSDVVQGLNSPSHEMLADFSGAPNSTTINQPMSATVNMQPKKPKPKAKRKRDYKPDLLPGQTRINQLP